MQTYKWTAVVVLVAVAYCNPCGIHPLRRNVLVERHLLHRRNENIAAWVLLNFSSASERSLYSPIHCFTGLKVIITPVAVFLGTVICFPQNLLLGSFRTITTSASLSLFFVNLFLPFLSGALNRTATFSLTRDSRCERSKIKRFMNASDELIRRTFRRGFPSQLLDSYFTFVQAYAAEISMQKRQASCTDTKDVVFEIVRNSPLQSVWWPMDTFSDSSNTPLGWCKK